MLRKPISLFTTMGKTILTLLFASSFFARLAAQPPNLDSLAIVIEAMPDDTAKIRQLFELANALYEAEFGKEGIYLRQGYALSKKLNAYVGIPRFESRLGANFANISLPDSAL